MNAMVKSLLVACVALFVCACGSSPQSLIVGKWEMSGAQVGGVNDEGASAAGKAIRMSAEFRKDGTARITMMGQTLQGTYKVNGENELVWKLNGVITTAKVKVSATELDVTDAENRTIRYTRR